MVDYVRHVSSPNAPLPVEHVLRYMSLHKKYRSHFEITASMLEAMKDVDATTFTLMKQARVSYRLLRKYLECLTELGLAETNIKKGRISFKTSEKGRDFLEQYHVLLEILSIRGRSNPTSVLCEADYYDSKRL